MLNIKRMTLVSAVLLAFSPLVSQASIVVDGDISDWGLDGWIPTNSSTSYIVDNYDPEVQATNGTSATYNPSDPSGGESYDAEAMYLEIKGDTLYIAIVTGLDPNNSSWKAGDIFFDLNDDVGDTVLRELSKSETAVTKSNGDTYYVDDYHGVVEAESGGDGYEYGLVVVDHVENAPYVDGNMWGEGSLYEVSQWNLGDGHEEAAHPVSGNTGTQVTGVTPSVNYSNSVINIGGQDSYLIEASINLDGNDFGNSLLASIGSGNINVHWNPLCNNDWIQFTGSFAYNPPSDGNPIPEPAPLALMAIGFIGMAARKKYKTNQ